MQRTYQGIPVSRSSVSRLEREVKVLRNRIFEIQTSKIFGAQDPPSPSLIEELRQAIESKEKQILEIKLML